MRKSCYSCFMGVFFLCCLTVSTFGQSSWTYADTWMDDETGYDETGANSALYIVGGGVAEIDTSSLAHSANMEVEVRSPSGRAEYGLGTWSQQSSGTSITVVVPLQFVWEPAETGNYTTTTNVQVTCPLEPGASQAGASFPIGVTFIAMELAYQLPTPAGYLYQKVQPCDVYCNAPQTNRYPGPSVGCIQLQIPFGPFGCSLVVRVVRNAQACVCFDIGYN